MNDMRKSLFIIILFFSTNLFASNHCKRQGETTFDDWTWGKNNSFDRIEIDFYNQTSFTITKIQIELSAPNKKDKFFTDSSYSLAQPKSSGSAKISVNNMNALKSYGKASLKGFYSYSDFDCIVKSNKKKNENSNKVKKTKKFNKTIYNNCVLSNLKSGMSASATGSVRYACRGKAEKPSIFDRLWYSW